MRCDVRVLCVYNVWCTYTMYWIQKKEVVEQCYLSGGSSSPTVRTDGRLHFERSRSHGEERPGRSLRSGYPAGCQTLSWTARRSHITHLLIYIYCNVEPASLRETQREIRLADPNLAMVEHSMCQPGLPLPHGDSQNGSWGLDLFQRAKSLESRLVVLPGETYSVLCIGKADISSANRTVSVCMILKKSVLYDLLTL